MSSAAKLRKYGRGTATVAAAALVVTSFGPTAFAWNTVTGTASNQAGGASIGLVDTDAKPGTQGATALTPGVSGQAIGDIRLVIPSTWQQGDYIDLRVGTGNAAGGQDRVKFTAVPTVKVDPKAYALTTHVNDTSGDNSGVVGSVEDGTQVAYTPVAGVSPRTPDVTTSLATAGSGANFENVIRIKFNNPADPATPNAKHILTISGAKVDVGASYAAGDLPVAATGWDASGTTDPDLKFFGHNAAGTGAANVTYPATIAEASLQVEGGSIVADGTDQAVGPLTVQAAGGKTFTTGSMTVTLTGASFKVTPDATADFYNAAGTLLETKPVTPGAQTLTTSATTGGVATRVVFKGVLIAGTTTAAPLSYALSATAGGLKAPSSPLGASDAASNQSDIAAPPSVSQANSVSSALPDRLGGLDRYQTAVKIAERALGEMGAGPGTGESDNVVIASGESFPDALSSGYLAATKNAQLILTRQGSLPQTDVEFLKNYGAKNIYIVGGDGAVSKAVEDQLRGMQSYDVQGVSSTTRRTVYDATITGAALTGSPVSVTGVAQQPQATITVTVARDASDNVASGDVTVSGLPGAQVSNVAITGNTSGTATIVWEGQTFNIAIPARTGGTAGDDQTLTLTSTSSSRDITTSNVSDGASATTAQRRVVPLDAKLTVLRLAGSDRFETNRRVNEYAGATTTSPIGTTLPVYGKPARKTAVLANGMTPWDALAAGPLVGNGAGNPIPVVLTSGSTLNPNAKAQMQNLDIEASLMVGGVGVLPDGLMKEQDGLGVYSSRLGGADRWGTARAVAEFALKSDLGSASNTAPGMGFAAYKQNPVLANGGSMNGSYTANNAANTWADALAAGPFAAATSRLIVLTDSKSLPGTTKDLLTANKANLSVPVIAVGLGDVVSTETVKAANDAITG